MKTPLVRSWSNSRLEDYKSCPLKFKLKHLDKLCTLCFKGKIMGGFDTPAMCDTCGDEVLKGPALERGTEIGRNLEHYVKGATKKLHTEIRHPRVKEIAKHYRQAFAKAPETDGEEAGSTLVSGAAELMLQFDRNWKYLGQEWTQNTWLIVKLDLVLACPPVAYVIDWKTGGIDKATGAVRASEKYDDQLSLYATAVLSAFPEIEEVDPMLVFVDCGPRFDPVVRRAGLTRAGLKAAQKKWEARAAPMFLDKVFAPSVSVLCRWCDYRKGKGGPCKF